MGIPRVRTELSVAYVDTQYPGKNGFENADDHIYLRSIAKRIGARSPGRAIGGRICHQVHLERFAVCRARP